MKAELGKDLKVKDLAKYLGATLYPPKNCEYDLDMRVTNLAPLDTAKVGDVSFLTNPKMRAAAQGSKASVMITPYLYEEIEAIQLVHKNPRAAMTLTSQLFYKPSHSFSGISDLAYVHPSAKVAQEAVLYPFSYVDKNAVIGPGTVVYPQVYIGVGCVIGMDVVLNPGAVLMEGTRIGDRVIVHGGAVLGGDGFGFEPYEEEILKVPQIGSVDIEDEVEIGPLCTIDRATFNKTIVGKGSKLDSQVHIGHNVELGPHSMLCGQVGIAGSTKIGKGFIAAGQSAIGPGLEVADKVVLGPKSGLTQSQKEPGEYMGMPIVPSGEWRRQAMALKKLPELLKKIKKLEKTVEKLQGDR